jgi:hypothetical protein
MAEELLVGPASDLPPGKRWQIGLLARLLHRHRPVPELQYASKRHPLFSQPLVELCLRIPLYTLLRGGGDRALERAAFRDVVPAPIIRRENKGTVAISAMSKIRECLPFLRELVLGGVLVRERIIDRRRLSPTWPEIGLPTTECCGRSSLASLPKSGRENGRLPRGGCSDHRRVQSGSGGVALFAEDHCPRGSALYAQILVEPGEDVLPHMPDVGGTHGA